MALLLLDQYERYRKSDRIVIYFLFKLGSKRPTSLVRGLWLHIVVRLHLPAHPSKRAIELKAAFEARGFENASCPKLCLVLGGDGTLLSAVHQYGFETSYLGINCGTLGFLMNDWAGSAEQVVDEVLALIDQDRLLAQSFSCLTVESLGPNPGQYLAINDCYIARATGQTCHLRVEVGGVEVVNKLVCDGIVAATPLGSTAYSFSAGGPVSHPLLSAIHLTAICPHTPRLVPMVLPVDTEIAVEVRSFERRPARLSVDGQDRGEVHGIRVRQAPQQVKLAFRPEHNFISTLVRKMLKVQG